ncbi:MAG: zinc ribbon domain-containing protein [Lachnospiraceae bacterium]|nr:zinc ribbon domain-containing protein [Lachnospiraceae bacterium]
MNKLEKLLSKWNFRKIAVVYLIAALVSGIACAATVGILYRERLNFAWQYSRLEEALEKEDEETLRAAVDKTAAASDDVIDILVLSDDNRVIYSAKDSEFAGASLMLTKVGEEKKYLASAEHPDSVFQYVKGDEFMLNSILNKDFSEIREDYEDDSFFESDLSSKTIYMLSCIRHHESDPKIYVINAPTSVPGGITALKAAAALAMLFFCIYWVLIALWMYRDAAKSKLSPIYWGLIGIFTNLIGLIVYKIYKRNTAVCTACGASQSTGHLYCSYCGSQLGTRCESCGGKVSPRDSFCHQCGSKLK